MGPATLGVGCVSRCLSAVTSYRRRMIDYVLAMRIMLHQMQTSESHRQAQPFE